MLNSMLPKAQQADVESNRDRLRGFRMPLTERELAILSVAVTELLNHDYRPFDDQIIIQVAPCSVCRECFVFSNRLGHWRAFWAPL